MTNKRTFSIASVSVFLILFLILFPFTASADFAKNTSSEGQYANVTSYDNKSVHVNVTVTNDTATISVGSSDNTSGQFVATPQIQLPVLPVANFSSNVTKGYSPFCVQFNDCSLNATKWNWEFGDGTNSTEQNPTHIYYSAGNYAVNLTISNENGNVSKSALTTVLPENRNGGIEWGPSIKHDTGSSNSISMDDAGNCVEVHVGSERLFYRVGKVNFDDNTIIWEKNIQTGSESTE